MSRQLFTHVLTVFQKKPQHDRVKPRGGGVKGRLRNVWKKTSNLVANGFPKPPLQPALSPLPWSVICNVFKMVILLCMSCVKLYDHMNIVERLSKNAKCGGWVAWIMLSCVSWLSEKSKMTDPFPWIWLSCASNTYDIVSKGWVKKQNGAFVWCWKVSIVVILSDCCDIRGGNIAKKL